MATISLEAARAWRRLRARPALTIVTIVLIGTAAATALLFVRLRSRSVVNPLGVPAADELIVLGWRRTPTSPPSTDFTYPVAKAVVDALPSVPVCLIGATSEILVNGNGVRGYVRADFLSWASFEVLGGDVQAGRRFAATDDVPGAAPVAILSDRLWHRVFGGDPGIIGTDLKVGDGTAVVVGIAAPSFRGLAIQDPGILYLPVESSRQLRRAGNLFGDRPGSEGSWLRIVGRAKVGGERESVRAVLAQRLSAGLVADIQPAANLAMSPAVRTAVQSFVAVLGISVGLVCGMAAVAAATWLSLLRRASSREVEARYALGAGSMNLMLPTLCEAGLVAVGSGLLLLPASAAILAVVGRYRLPGDLAISDLQLTPTVGSVILVASTVFSAMTLIALLAGRRGNSVAAAGWALVFGPVGRHGFLLLLAGQAALTFAATAGGLALLVTVSTALTLVDPVDGATLAVAEARLGTAADAREGMPDRFEALRAALAQHPRIRAVSLVSEGATVLSGLALDGHPDAVPGRVDFEAVDRAYFSTVGIHLVEGRDFRPADAAGTPPVAIVSATLASQMKALTGSAIGLRLSAGSSSDPVEVVGVVQDLVTSVSRPRPLVVYVPLPQFEPTGFSAYRRTVWLRSTEAGSAVLRDATEVLRSQGAVAPVPSFVSLRNQVADAMMPQRLGAAFLLVFAVAFGLAAVLGTHLVTALEIKRRLPALAVRAAVGAPPHVMVRDACAPIAFAIGLGVAAGTGLVLLIAPILGRAVPGAVAPGTRVLCLAALLVLGSFLPASVGGAVELWRVPPSVLLRRSGVDPSAGY
ncbi:MAG: ABC transporter permease [Vicinamibacterales bacterium]